jgi:hypothetical protein
VSVNCDDGLYCNGQELCSANACVRGTGVDCAGYDNAAVSECGHNPDNNPFTFDSYPGFISTCDEGADSCTTEIVVINHTCSTGTCGAECASDVDCAETDCDVYDGCIGNDYYEYDDVANNCDLTCSCSSNGCASPTVLINDARCVACTIDDDFNVLDNDYCSGDSIMHDEGRCINFTCQIETIALNNCSTMDNSYCSGDGVIEETYTCNSAVCINDVNNTVDCDDGLYCNGVESCSLGACTSGTAIDCSGNNIAAVSECGYSPDDNPFTFDTYPGFVSMCDEGADSCTTNSIVLNHTCNIGTCGAECEDNSDCADTVCTDECIGNDYYYYNVTTNDCLGNCSCENNACSVYNVSINDPICAASNDIYISYFLGKKLGGNKVAFSWMINNVGAYELTDVSWQIDTGESIITGTVDSLSSNGKKYGIYTYEYLTLGTYTVTFTADYNNTINELDETNNDVSSVLILP